MCASTGISDARDLAWKLAQAPQSSSTSARTIRQHTLQAPNGPIPFWSHIRTQKGKCPCTATRQNQLQPCQHRTASQLTNPKPTTEPCGFRLKKAPFQQEPSWRRLLAECSIHPKTSEREGAWEPGLVPSDGPAAARATRHTRVHRPLALELLFFARASMCEKCSEKRRELLRCESLIFLKRLSGAWLVYAATLAWDCWIA